jgi:hypothetical protein
MSMLANRDPAIILDEHLLGQSTKHKGQRSAIDMSRSWAVIATWLVFAGAARTIVSLVHGF